MTRPPRSTTPSASSGPGSASSGVRLEKLVAVETAPIQGMLGEADHGWRDADRAVDRASARFGAGSVRPASLIDPGPTFPGRRSRPILRETSTTLANATKTRRRALSLVKIINEDTTTPHTGRTPCRCRSTSRGCSSSWSRPWPPRTPSSPRAWRAPAVAGPRVCAGSSASSVCVVGLGLVLVGIQTTMWVGAAGFAVMVAAVAFALTPPRRGGKLAVVRDDGSDRAGRPPVASRRAAPASWTSSTTAGTAAAATAGADPPTLRSRRSTGGRTAYPFVEVPHHGAKRPDLRSTGTLLSGHPIRPTRPGWPLG